MTNPIPDGCDGLIPHLVVEGAEKAMEFYAAAFGAEELMRMPHDDGRLMHAEMRCFGRMLFLADDFPEFCGGKQSTPAALGGTPVSIMVYVEDVDAAFARATEAGANVTMPPTDMFWGDRYAKVTDPFGHEWALATHVKDLSPDEMQAAAAAAFAG